MAETTSHCTFVAYRLMNPQPNFSIIRHAELLTIQKKISSQFFSGGGQFCLAYLSNWVYRTLHQIRGGHRKIIGTRRSIMFPTCSSVSTPESASTRPGGWKSRPNIALLPSPPPLKNYGRVGLGLTSKSSFQVQVRSQPLDSISSHCQLNYHCLVAKQQRNVTEYRQTPLHSDRRRHWLVASRQV